MRTHTKKKDRQWVNQHAEDTNDCRLPQERAGLQTCKVPSRLKPPVYDSNDVFTTSGPIDMREQVTLLNRELGQRSTGRSGVQSVEEHRVSDVEFHAEHVGRLGDRLQRQNAISDASSTASARTYECDTPASAGWR
ncbi:hypothetical protein PIB30_088706 [Stylosanthes scabra]|uniref:Uncharacterized protein n=1 Tax=Stylosanthes scabra TaxID=79078 RepID=A0ABU6WS51_9FABA|nr:hypothetical protein [Stylosanthes scabra]